ncbi:MAG: hypothetical protein ACKVIV_07800 [Flavobacteriales bacterium]|jgi:hypothetical protein|tara:strand:+ start:575 stop:1375 length:801 start_codon:yes stop_codon:yes gene_type:complete
MYNNLVIESVSNGPLFGQTFNLEMVSNLSSIKRKFILSRIPFIPYSIKSKLFSLSKKEVNSNGLILHGGGPIYSNSTIQDNECCNPLELDPKDPHFIEKTSGGLKLEKDDPMVQTAKYPNRVIGNFTAMNRFFTEISSEFIASSINRKLIPTSSKKQIIEAYIKSAEECKKLDNKIILEQTATFAFRSKNHGDVNEPAKDTITGIMLFVWGIKGQIFNGTILGGTGIFNGITGEFTRERLLAPNFSGAETFRITFPTTIKPDYYPI